MTFNPGLISIILGFTCQICKLPYMAICLLLRLFPPGFIYWENIYMSKMLCNSVLNIILSTLIFIFSFYIIQTFMLVYFYIYYIPIDFFISPIIFKVYFTIPLVVIYDLGYFYERNSMVFLNSTYLCSLISYYIVFHYYIM